MPALWTQAPLRRWRNTLAGLGLAAIAAFVAALVVLHLAAGRDLPAHMSEFAHSRFALLWATAVYTFILGGSMVVWALRPSLKDCPSKWIGIAMLWLAAIGAVLLAVFPTDQTYVQTFSGKVHNDAALSTFALLGLAMVVLAPAFAASPGLDGFARISVLLGVLVTGSWVTYIVTTLKQIAVYAPAQRILVGFITTWFVLLALRLRAASRLRPLPTEEDGRLPWARRTALAVAEPLPVAVRRRKPALSPVRATANRPQPARTRRPGSRPGRTHGRGRARRHLEQPLLAAAPPRARRPQRLAGAASS